MATTTKILVKQVRGQFLLLSPKQKINERLKIAPKQTLGVGHKRSKAVTRDWAHVRRETPKALPKTLMSAGLPHDRLVPS